MRRFTIVQPIDADVARHWQLFLDDAFDRAQYLEHFKYPAYEIVERAETDVAIKRTIRVTPKLDLPAPVAKVLGNGFGYVEAGTFDKRTQTWRSRTTPNRLASVLHSEAVVRVEPRGADRCARTCEIVVEARVFAVGGLVEQALEKNLRDGWAASAAYMNARLRATAP